MEPSSLEYHSGDVPPKSLHEYLILLFYYRRIMVLVPVAILTLVLILTFLSPRTYTSEASFVPQSAEEGQSITAGLAAQLGFSMFTGVTGHSPEFYVELITSRSIMTSVVESRFTVIQDGREIVGSIIEFLEITGDLHGENTENALVELDQMIATSLARDTGVVTVSISSQWPDLSLQVNDLILQLLNEFNLETRQLQASAERKFIEGRLVIVQDSLRTSEDALLTFLQQNRRYEDSHELTFIHDRLQRTVLMRQQVFTTLMQAYEQARIDEVRDTPVITVIDDPNLPILPDSRNVALRTILSLLLGIIFSLSYIVGTEMVRGNHLTDQNMQEKFDRLKRETCSDLRKPWRLFKTSAGGYR
ncbi:hypothetical protein ACFL41_02575 [Gemmatimonadota bacterium]